jgi:hypothetical protein
MQICCAYSIIGTALQTKLHEDEAENQVHKTSHFQFPGRNIVNNGRILIRLRLSDQTVKVKIS